MMKGDVYPMHRAPRCTARSKCTGAPCRNPAVRGWKVCRMHGARSGHPAGPAHPSWKHGLRSRAHVAMRKEINTLARETKRIARLIDA